MAERNGGTLPGIFLNTLPKSGSVFLINSLSKVLSMEQMQISGSYFPDDLVMVPWLQKLARGNIITQEHLPARRLNLALLRRFIDRLILHVRDPRQATLSWVHHLQMLKRVNEVILLDYVEPPLPEGYFERPLAEQIDWNIDHHLPALVSWVEGWVKAERLAWFTPTILFTTYEEFRGDQPAFFRRLLHFYDIEPNGLDLSIPVPREGDQHFRRGSTDEWRVAFSAAQQAKANALIPEDLAIRFGWPLA